MQLFVDAKNKTSHSIKVLSSAAKINSIVCTMCIFVREGQGYQRQRTMNNNSEAVWPLLVLVQS